MSRDLYDHNTVKDQYKLQLRKDCQKGRAE